MILTGIDFYKQALRVRKKRIRNSNRKPIVAATIGINEEKVNIDITILTLLSNGKTMKEISVLVFLSKRTIEGRLNRMRDTLKCSTLSHLVAVAIRKQIIQ